MGGGGLLAGLVLLAPGPRDYAGPEAGPAAQALEVPTPVTEPVSAPVAEPRPVVPTGRWTPPRPALPPRDGKAAFIAGSVLSGIGATMMVVRIAGFESSRRTGDFGRVAGMVGLVTAPLMITVSQPLLGIGARNSRYYRIHRASVRDDRRPSREGRGWLAGGVVMATAGSALVFASSVSVDYLDFTALHLMAALGTPLAIGGPIIAGDAQGRRLGGRDYAPAVAVAPLFGGGAVVTVGGRM